MAEKMKSIASTTSPVSDPIEPLILRVRGQRILLDADLARLYGVTTGALNQAIRRNAGRFPNDFAFQLTASEFADLRSKTMIASSQHIDLKQNIKNRSQSVIGSRRSRHYIPWAFTEHGALMAANVLRSEHAVQMSVFVIRAFVQIREQVAANTAVLKRLAEIDQSLLEHDVALLDIYRKLLPLLDPPPDPPRRGIGFIREDD